MRVLVLSDLHLEFGAFTVQPCAADVVILAGDIAPGLRGITWASEVFPESTVLYVPGNHEYYGFAIPKLTELMRDRARDLGVHLLDEEEIVIDGVRFLGCTLWTDLALFGDVQAAGIDVISGMNDVRKIRVSPTYRKLRPSDMFALHGRSRRWLQTALAAEPDTPTVIVTHHAPSARSLDPRHLDDPLSVAYASHLDEMVAASGALLWIHGHTHYRVDYPIGRTRVLSNPRGYVDDPVPGFDPTLVVEL